MRLNTIGRIWNGIWILCLNSGIWADHFTGSVFAKSCPENATVADPEVASWLVPGFRFKLMLV